MLGTKATLDISSVMLLSYDGESRRFGIARVLNSGRNGQVTAGLGFTHSNLKNMFTAYK